MRKAVSKALLKDHQDVPVKRRLSQTIQTRWYRAPEVICCETEYHQSTDIWSIGCILFEIMNCTVKKKTNDSSKKSLVKAKIIAFKGDSCYPLSPVKQKDGSENIQISQNDQMFKIFEKLGQSDDFDLSFVKNEVLLKYIAEVQSSCKKIGKGNNFSELFPTLSPDLINLMTQMLQLNPHFRPTASDCLKSPIFDEIRISTSENVTADPINCMVDCKYPPVY